MSYILDALKKADAQRERDPSRGIHAQPAALAPAQRAGGTAPWAWAGAAAVLAVLAVGGWLLVEDRAPVASPAVAVQDSAPRRVAPASAPVQAPVAPPATAAAPQGEPAAPAVLPPPQAPQAVAADSEEPVAGARRRRRIPVPVAAVPASHAASGAISAAANPASAATPAAVAAPSPAPAQPTALVAGLPPDAPKLAISGGVYSSNRAQRMLIVNGQVVNEGADLGSGVVLEEIRPKAAVLRFHGARYTVGF